MATLSSFLRRFWPRQTPAAPPQAVIPEPPCDAPLDKVLECMKRYQNESYRTYIFAVRARDPATPPSFLAPRDEETYQNVFLPWATQAVEQALPRALDGPKKIATFFKARQQIEAAAPHVPAAAAVLEQIVPSSIDTLIQNSVGEPGRRVSPLLVMLRGRQILEHHAVLTPEQTERTLMACMTKAALTAKNAKPFETRFVGTPYSMRKKEEESCNLHGFAFMRGMMKWVEKMVPLVEESAPAYFGDLDALHQYGFEKQAEFATAWGERAYETWKADRLQMKKTGQKPSPAFPFPADAATNTFKKPEDMTKEELDASLARKIPNMTWPECFEAADSLQRAILQGKGAAHKKLWPALNRLLGKMYRNSPAVALAWIADSKAKAQSLKGEAAARLVKHLAFMQDHIEKSAEPVQRSPLPHCARTVLSLNTRLPYAAAGTLTL